MPFTFNNFFKPIHNSLLEEEFRAKTVKLKSERLSKIIPKHIYVDLDVASSTMFVREQDDIELYDILIDDKGKRRYVIKDIDNRLITKKFKVTNVDFPFKGRVAKYDLLS